MYIVRSPLRITLAGGGTDLPSYYKLELGRVISASIDKYVYVSVHRPFEDKIILKYSQIEELNEFDKIKNPIIREGLKLNLKTNSPIEVTSIADIPSGTGLGSSGSFGTALIKALKLYTGQEITKHELAEMACNIEIEILKEPVGKQDQYIAAFGGIKLIEIEKSGNTKVSDLGIPHTFQNQLENSLQLFFTNKTRSASEILKDQDSRSLAGEKEIKCNLDKVLENSFLIEKALLQGQLDDFAMYMHQHWQEKKLRTISISNSVIDDLYEFSLRNGASGGKIVGAGGGGFLLTFSRDPEKLSSAMASRGIREVKFNFEHSGTTQVI